MQYCGRGRQTNPIKRKLQILKRISKLKLTTLKSEAINIKQCTYLNVNHENLV